MSQPNKEHIQLLVDELRSTKRRQTKHTLTKVGNNRKSHCCLGIATELAIRHGVKVDQLVESACVGTSRIPAKVVIYVSPTEYPEASRSTLLSVVRDWYGFSNSDPNVIDAVGELDTASNLNDSRGYDFSEIADAFERTYLKESHASAE